MSEFHWRWSWGARGRSPPSKKIPGRPGRDYFLTPSAPLKSSDMLALYKFDYYYCEGVSNIITLLRFPGSAFSGTSILGQLGQICFAKFLKIISSFFAQIFCTDRVDILLCSERKKTGGFSSKFGTLAPSKYCGRRRQARTRLRPRRVLLSKF